MKSRSLKSILCGAASPNAPGDQGRTPLHRAARTGRFEDLLILLEHGADVHQCDNFGERPLQMAARKGHLLCVKALLQAGADVNHVPPSGNTAFSESALCSVVRNGDAGDNLQIFESLLRVGANPNAASTAKRFPVHEAAFCGSVVMVTALLAAGAGTDVLDYSGQTPLHRALTSQSAPPEIIILFLQAGTDANIPDSEGIAPVFYTINNRANSPLLLRALLTAQPDLTITDPRNGDRQPLALAIDRELETIVGMLREAGAPEPEPAPGRESTFIVETEDGDQVEVEVSCSMVESSEDDQLSPEDQALVEDLQANASLLPLRSPYGWMASRAHWMLLSAATAPLLLTRLAYFARGFRNSPPGKELDDGPEILGESYQDAVSRFLDLRLLETVESAKAIARASTIQELRKVAKPAGLVGKTKDVLVDKLIRELGELELLARLQSPPRYLLTATGSEQVANRQPFVHSILHDLAFRLRQQVSQSNLREVLHTLTLIEPLIRHINIRQSASSTHCKLARIREIMDVKRMEGFSVSEAEATLWKTWAVLSSFCLISEWPSPPWLEIPQLCVDRKLQPFDVFKAHFPQYVF